MPKLGTLSLYIEVEFVYLEGGIFFMKNNYGLKLLSKYGMLECSAATTPMEEGTRLQQNMDEPFVNTGQYQSLVGSLIFFNKH